MDRAQQRRVELMNTADVVRLLAEQCGLSEDKAVEVLDALFGTEPGKGIIASVLDDEARLTFQGFGTFGVKGRSARTTTHQVTGETVTISAKKVAYFKPARPLRDRVAQRSAPAEVEESALG